MINGIQQYVEEYYNVRPSITDTLQTLLDKIMLDYKPINEL
jgi:hypothetical protein